MFVRALFLPSQGGASIQAMLSTYQSKVKTRSAKRREKHGTAVHPRACGERQTVTPITAIDIGSCTRSTISSSTVWCVRQG